MSKTSAKAKDPDNPSVILIRMWPKTPVLYPMAIMALICGIVGLFSDPSSIVDRFMGLLFLSIFTFSLFSVCVDLEVRWALFGFAMTLGLSLVLILLNQKFGFLPGFSTTLSSLSPTASPTFYFIIFIIWVALMIVSFLVANFHYVKIESNEVIVVDGLLERQRRYPTMRMRFTRDIQDVFEYYLPFVRSGRLILTFAESSESIVIDNVINIDKVTRQLDEVSSVLKVNTIPATDQGTVTTNPGFDVKND